MGVTEDSRGVSEVLGAILVFSILIAGLGLFQVTVVPDKNAEVEFKHNERVRQDMGNVQGVISRIAATGTSEKVTVNTGMRYPTRMLFLNPSPVSGTLRTDTVGSGQITMANVEATDAETRDYVQGTFGGFETRKLVYEPSYNLYHNPPETSYLSTVLYNDFDDGVTIQDEGTLVSGNRITLVTLEGDMSQASVGSTSFSPEPLSAPARTVSVTGEGGNNLIITVPTELDEDTWRNKILDDEPNVIDVTGAGPGEVDIVLDGSVTYDLRMAKIGIGSGTTDEGAHYVTAVRGGKESVIDSGSQELVVEVRDRFNNPVSGVKVPFEAAQGEFQSTGTNRVTAMTDENGRASVTFVPDDLPTGATQNVDIQVGGDLDFDGDGNPDFDPDGDGTSQDRERVDFTVKVVDPGSGGSGSGLGTNLNPNDPVIADDADTSGHIIGGGGGGGGSIDCDATTCLARVVFKKQGASSITITEMRFIAYLPTTSPGNGSRGLPSNVRVVDDSCTQDRTLPLQGDYEDVPFGTISGGGDTKTLFFRFDDGVYDNIEGDGFVVSIKYDQDGDGTSDTSAVYIITPTHDSGVSDPCP